MFIVVCAVDGDGRIAASRREPTASAAAIALARVRAEYPAAFVTEIGEGSEHDHVADMQARTISYSPLLDPLAYRRLRAEEYARLMPTGDQLDTLWAAIEAMPGTDAEAEAMLQVRAEIKARHPKPER